MYYFRSTFVSKQNQNTVHNYTIVGVLMNTTERAYINVSAKFPMELYRVLATRESICIHL